MFRILTYNQLIENNSDDKLYIIIRSREEYDRAIDFLESKGATWNNNTGARNFTPEWANKEVVRGTLCYSNNRLLQSGSILEPNISVSELIGEEIRKIEKPRIRWYNDGKLVENNSEDIIWKIIPLPEEYPNTTHCWDWLNDHEEDVISSEKVKFLITDWDYRTLEYESFEKELSVKGTYVDKGFLVFETDEKDYEVIGEEIEIQIKVNRTISENDPYGEEVWESTNQHLFDPGDIAVYTGNKKERKRDLVKIKGYLHNNKDGSESYNVVFIEKPNDYGVFACNTDYLKLSKKGNFNFIINKIDPYGEEIWDDIDENKINELFDTEKTYNYKFVKTRTWMKPFIDDIYRFTSKDNITYYVTITYDPDNGEASVKFTDKDHYFKLTRLKDRYVNIDKHDAINVLNTVFKICKDYYDENKDEIMMVKTNTRDEKRLNVYEYIMKKYFKNWKVDTYSDETKGEYYIECSPV